MEKNWDAQASQCGQLPVPAVFQIAEKAWLLRDELVGWVIRLLGFLHVRSGAGYPVRTHAVLGNFLRSRGGKAVGTHRAQLIHGVPTDQDYPAS